MSTTRQIQNSHSSDLVNNAARKKFFSRRRTGRLVLNIMAAAGLLYILTPLIFVTWLSFYQQEIPSFPPEGYSFRWYAEITNNQQFMDGFLLSLQVGLVATFIGLMVGVPAAMCLIRHKFIGRGLVNNLLLLPLLVPGVVLGTAFYVFQVQIEIVTDGNIPVIGSMGGLIFGHVLIVIPWTVRLVATALSGFDTRIEEAAQNLGASRWVTFRRITLPAILPGIVAAGMFSFVNSFTNLEMSLFLIGPGSTTLPIATLQYLQWKLDPTIAAVSVLQILVVAIAMLVTDRYVKISRVV